jgi:hypothetical protein
LIATAIPAAVSRSGGFAQDFCDVVLCVECRRGNHDRIWAFFYFVGRRSFFQQRAEMLLLNLLPKETSDRLAISESKRATRLSKP